jgi:hypothetical protein
VEPFTKLTTVFLRLPVIVTITSYVFLILSSRPTADEYLLAPILRGYYVDQPQTPLFQPASDFSLSYIQGANAIVRLGWDAWLNALTFQMGSSALTNYFGPLSTMFQALLFASAVLIGSYLISTYITTNRKHKSFVYCFLVIGLLLAVPAANFNTPRVNFGLYTFLGIRFGLYLVHAVVLVAMITFLLKSEASANNNKRDYFSIILIVTLFCGFVSLWYVLYLLLFVFARLLFSLIRRKMTYFYPTIITTILVSTYFMTNGLKGSRGRTSAAETPIFNIVQNFIKDVVLNHESRLYKIELWNTVFGVHSLIAFLIGSLMVLVAHKSISLNLKNLKTITTSMLASVTVLPMIYAFQEYVTYEAWWHRTTPIVLSIFAFLFFGIWITAVTHAKVLKGPRTVISIAALVALFAMATVPAVNGIQSVHSFRSDWDAGNILALGSPLENNADYNVINAFRLSPYINKNWDVQERMIGAVPLSVQWFDENNRVIENRVKQLSQVFSVSTNQSVFDTELGGSISYRIGVTDLSGLGGYVSLRDLHGVTTHRIEPGVGRLTELTGELSQPGSVSLLNHGRLSSNLLNLEILKVELGFSGAIREERRIQVGQFVEKVE